MTTTTEHLRKEHEEVKRMLDAFARFLDDLEEREVEDSREASGFIDFLGEGLFQKHEEKEEGILLPELARMGLSWSDGALAHVRQEHRQGRYFFRSLRQAMRQGEKWSKDDRAHFLSIAREWIHFVRQHMEREERILFPYVDGNVESDADARLTRDFEQTDREYDEMSDSQMLRDAMDAFLERHPPLREPSTK